MKTIKRYTPKKLPKSAIVIYCILLLSINIGALAQINIPRLRMTGAQLTSLVNMQGVDEIVFEFKFNTNDFPASLTLVAHGSKARAIPTQNPHSYDQYHTTTYELARIGIDTINSPDLILGNLEISVSKRNNKIGTLSLKNMLGQNWQLLPTVTEVIFVPMLIPSGAGYSERSRLTYEITFYDEANNAIQFINVPRILMNTLGVINSTILNPSPPATAF